MYTHERLGPWSIRPCSRQDDANLLEMRGQVTLRNVRVGFGPPDVWLAVVVVFVCAWKSRREFQALMDVVRKRTIVV